MNVWNSHKFHEALISNDKVLIKVSLISQEKEMPPLSFFKLAFSGVEFAIIQFSLFKGGKNTWIFKKLMKSLAVWLN